MFTLPTAERMADEGEDDEVVPPSEAEDPDFVPKRQRRGRRMTREVVSTIASVRDYFELEAQQGFRVNINQPLLRTSTATGWGSTIIKEISAYGPDHFPPGCEPERRRRERKCPPETKALIREAFADLIRERGRITLDILRERTETMAATRELHYCPSRASLQRLMPSCGLTYAAGKNHYQQLKEKLSIVHQRDKYIRRIQVKIFVQFLLHLPDLFKELRAEGRVIYYQDETWFASNMHAKCYWRDEEGNGAPNLKSGVGARLMISHVGSSATGLLHPAELIYDGKSKADDYHSNMNSDIFLDWLSKKVLPNIPSSSVLVLDRVCHFLPHYRGSAYRQAPYHTKLTEDSQHATSNLRKGELVAWILRHDASRRQDELSKLTMLDLWPIADALRPEPMTKAEVLCTAKGVILVFLPVGHPELNPIELVWAQVKSYIRRNNSEFTLGAVRKLGKEKMASITAEHWKRCEQHCISVEMQYLTQTQDDSVEYDHLPIGDGFEFDLPDLIPLEDSEAFATREESSN
jgi:transposase